MNFLIRYIYRSYNRNHYSKKGNKNLLIRIHTFIFSNNHVIRLIFGVKIDDKLHKRNYPHKYDFTTILLKNYLSELIKNCNTKLNILEIGTGYYGILPIYLKKKFDINIDATDLDPKAIDSTKLNLKLNMIDIKVFESDLFQNIKFKEYDLIFWNLPYYRKTEDYMTVLIDQSDKYLKKNGKLILGYNSTPLDPKEVSNIVKKNQNLIYEKSIRYSWNKHIISVILKK